MTAETTENTRATNSEKASDNPIGLLGIEFMEFTGPDPAHFDQIFKGLGFSKLKKHSDKAIFLYQQNKINFLFNQEPSGFSSDFSEKHGQSVCSIGLRVKDAQKAFDEALRRGATPYQNEYGEKSYGLNAVFGVGDSLIYFVDTENYYNQTFTDLENPEVISDKGFICIDHLTNNVFKGTMGQWSDFYKDIFGFREIRYFDIKGEKTGLTSFALRSPCNTFAIPINEGNEEKSQIEEYLREYKGAGVQHIALLSGDLLSSLDKMAQDKVQSIETLDIDDDYYDEVFQRVPNVTEDQKQIQKHQVLVDGDEAGYLLQIFTKNVFGPVFFEMIQRKNHQSFGEGNFGALFKSIERDQERRGVL